MLKQIILKGEQKKVLFLPATNPIQIKGVAGSGKTTVALYRAKHLLETQSNLFKETKIVIFTYNKTLAAYIKAIKPYINGGYQKDTDDRKPSSTDGLNVQIINFHSWAYRFLGLQRDQTIASWEQTNLIASSIRAVKSDLSKILEKGTGFFQEEISWIKGKVFGSEVEYLDAARIGRGTSDRVTKIDKEVIWKVYVNYEEKLSKLGKIDFDDYAISCLKKINTDPQFVPPYTHIVIDEAQDLTKAQILAISKLVSKDTNSLSIIADAAQRIMKSGFVWSEVGINVRGGRTIEFKKNYRNSVPIAKAAISLLDKEKDKSEFTTVEAARKGGEKPKLCYHTTFELEAEYLIKELNRLKSSDSLNGTVVLHRNKSGVSSTKRLLEDDGFSTELVRSSTPINYASESIKLCTMSSIKGLEFENVFILGLDEGVMPFPHGFIDADDEFHISTERRLLYTCMTRAKRELHLSSASNRPSRYLKEIDETLVDIVGDKP